MTFIVSFTVNDYNGVFTGRCCGIHFKDILFTPTILNGVGFTQSNKQIILENVKLSYIYTTTCGATWCADDYQLDFFNFKKLLNYLKQSNKWILEESPSYIDILFEKETMLTSEDIEKIIKEN